MNLDPQPSAAGLNSPVDPQVRLEQRWQVVQSLRPLLAKELKRLAHEVSGDERRQLLCWSVWFQAETELEDALRRPDILALVTPILCGRGADEFTTADIAQIADSSLGLVAVNPSVFRRVLRAVRHPLLVLVGFALLWLAFITWLAPELREMFSDFGIKFSSATGALLGVTPWLHVASGVVAALAVFVFLIVAHQLRMDGRRAPNAGWLDRRLVSTRSAVGAWAWHVGLLMQAGMNAFESARVAGQASVNPWVKSESFAWASAASLATVDADAPPSNGDAVIFKRSPFRLVSRTMQMPDSEAKTALLQQAARYYLDRDRSVGDWWLRLLASLIVWNVGVASVMFFVAMYSTLLIVVRGLTLFL